MTERFSDPESMMAFALELAARGVGHVEPNPPVGAVVVDDSGQRLGSGYHQAFGSAHAEVNAIVDAGSATQGATLVVTLEPCSHDGKTPPCTNAVIAAGFRRVIVGCTDPAPHASGAGVDQLRSAGIDVTVGVLAGQAKRLIAPFRKLVVRNRPWVHAKWAMTLDGRIASRTGSSQWISSAQSRDIVHRLRGRMDAIVVGSETARVDDPLLTARPTGARTAVRIVTDSQARLPLDSQLVRTAADCPVLIAAADDADDRRVSALERAGVDVLRLPRSAPSDADATGTGLCLDALLIDLGHRNMTNILVEGGGTLLGSLFDQRAIDEAHVFIAPKVVGGTNAVAPVGGYGLDVMSDTHTLTNTETRTIDGDLYVRGDVVYTSVPDGA